MDDETEAPPSVMTPEEFRKFFNEPEPEAAAPAGRSSWSAPRNDADLPLIMTPDEFDNMPGTATRYGAFGRGFAEGVIPATTGMAGGILTGAGIGAAVSGPFAPAAALIGGVAGGIATGYGAHRLQEAGLEAGGVREGTGWFSRNQQATDEALFPYARAAGGMAAALPTLRPGGTLIERGISAGIGGAAEGVTDYVQHGKVDPWKVGMGMAAGAAMPNVNKPFSDVVGRVAPRSWQAHMPNFQPGEWQGPPEMQGPRQPFGPPTPKQGPPAPMHGPPEMQGPQRPQGPPAPVHGPPEMQGPRLPQGPAEPTVLERRMAIAQREFANADPEMREYWGYHLDALSDRVRAEQSGHADTETTPQGGGLPSTPRDMDLANDITTAAAGVAHVNRPVEIKSAGMPGGGAPMRNREAAAVRSPERDYAKDTVTRAPGEPTVPSTSVSRHPLGGEDFAAALGGFEAPGRAAQRRIGITENAALQQQDRQRAASDAQVAAQNAMPQPPTMTPRPGRLNPTAPRLGPPPRQPTRPRLAGAPPELGASTPPPAPAPVAPPRPAPVAAPVTPPAAPRPTRSPPVVAPDEARLAANNRRIAELEAAIAARAQPAPAPAAPRAPATVTPIAPKPAAKRPPAAETAIAASMKAAEAKKAAAPAAVKPTLGLKPKPATATKTVDDLIQGVAKNRGTTPEAALNRLLNNKPAQATAAAQLKMTPEQLRTQLETKSRSAKQEKPVTADMAQAKAAGIDTSKPTWREKWKKFVADTGGSIDIGPVDPAWKTPKSVYSRVSARLTDRTFVEGMPGENLAAVLSLSARGNAQWALGALNKYITRHPGIEQRRPNLAEARDILSKRTEAEPGPRAEPSPPVPAPAEKTPLVRTTEKIRDLPELPTKTTMQQLDKRGRVFREAPYDRAKMEKWHEQFPDFPIAPRQTSVTRPSTPRHETPEPPAKPKPEKSVPQDQAPAPGRRTPGKVIDPVTGEARETKIFRDEPAPTKSHGLDNYTPDEKMRFMDAIEALPEAKQVEALALTKAVPKEKILANLDNLSSLKETERTGRTLESRKMSTGGIADNLQDKAHKEGILAAHKTAYDANPRPAQDETLAQTIERATRIVKAANDEINKTVARLTLEKPKYAHIFTGVYDTAQIKDPTVRSNIPASTKIVDAARALVKKPTAAQKAKFDSEEILALVPETKETGGGLTGTPETVAPEEAAGPRYAPKVDPDSPLATSEHKDLTDMLNGLSEKAHAMLQDAWGDTPISKEVANTKAPLDLKRELLGALIDAQDKKDKYAHALPETLVNITPVSDRAGIARVEQTGRFAPTKIGKASEPTVIDKGTDAYNKIADQVLKFFGKGKEQAAKLARGEEGGKGTEYWQERIARTEKKYADEAEAREKAGLIHDERGSLDVTKVFDWIDKFASKFRPDREPMIPTGMTRLYRDGNTPWTTRPNVETPTKFVDVPTAVIEQVRVDGLAGVGEKAAKRFANKWAREIAVNPEGPDQRVSFEPKELSTIDHLRRLWADESGALDIGKLPNWVPKAASRVRSHFVPEASPAVMDYMKTIGKDATIMGTAIAKKIQDVLYASRKAVLPDTKKPPNQVESQQMYRAWEDNKLNTLPPRLQNYYKEHVAPLIKKAEVSYDELREIMARNKFPGWEDLPERVDNGPEYAKFIFRRQNIPFDEATGFDAISNSNRLSLWTPSIEPRQWFALQQDGTKTREIFHVNKDGNAILYKDGQAMGSIKVPDGVDPSLVGSRIGDKLVDHAKVSELVQHGRNYDPVTGTATKFTYHENPMLVAGDAHIGLSQSLERAKFIDRLVNDPEFQDYASASSKSAAEEKWGKGNVKQTNLPHFNRKGFERWFPKQIAWALDDAVKTGFNYGENTFMDRLARFNQATLKPFYFLGPEVHVFNVLDKLLVGRGFDNLNVQKSWRNMSTALRDVRNQGPMMDLIMQSGGNPMFVHSMTQRAYPNLARTLGVEVAQRPWKWDPLRRAFGIDVKNKYWEPTYQKSNDMMWWQSDVLYQMLFRDNLDRHGGGHKAWQGKFDELNTLNEMKTLTPAQTAKRNELTAWQKELGRKAVVETEKIVDGYTVPTTFGKTLGIKEGSSAGRAIQQVLTEQALTNFGRFSYGLYKALANVAKNMAGQNENLTPAQSAALGFSQAGMLLFTANVMYPLLSKAYQQAPWAKPESEVEKRGVTSMAMIIPEMIHKGVKDGWSRLAQRAWAPSTLASGTMEIFQNRDFAGRAIIESGSGWGEVPGQAAEYAVSKLISPATGISRAAQKEGPGFSTQRFIESNFGVKTPTDSMIKYEANREKKLRQEGRTREKHPRGVIEATGSAIHKAIRGYEHGGLVTATATGVIPTSRR